MEFKDLKLNEIKENETVQLIIRANNNDNW